LLGLVPRGAPAKRTNGGLIIFARKALWDPEGHCIEAVGISGGAVDQDEVITKSARLR
jgi:uncharacterized protein GlcG (DUF336 family)